jgi:hypothetical protein
VKGWSGLDVVFVVKHLRVQHGWAFAATEPRSPDGRARYEPVAALLRRSGGTWTIVETRPCCAACGQDPDCADDTRYFTSLRARFPSAPAAIFP